MDGESREGGGRWMEVVEGADVPVLSGGPAADVVPPMDVVGLAGPGEGRPGTITLLSVGGRERLGTWALSNLWWREGWCVWEV